MSCLGDSSVSMKYDNDTPYACGCDNVDFMFYSVSIDFDPSAFSCHPCNN